MAGFANNLQVKIIEDGLYELIAPLNYYSDILGKELEFPVGFQTDLASVPRFLPFIFWFWGGRAHHESVPHDGLYKSGLVTRKTADLIFLEAMKARKKPFYVRWPMYLGVRLGGWLPWRNYRKAEQKSKL